MEQLTLNAQPRTILGKKVKKIRSQGNLPVVLYGHDIKTESLTVDSQEFTQVFKKAGISTLVNLHIEGEKPFKVLLHEPQRDPIKNQYLHADFYKIKMTEKIRTEIPLNFIGIAPAVDELEGNLITSRDNIEIECLPDALVSSIDVDITTLKTFDDIIHVSDIKIPEGITVLNDPEEAVVLVTPPRSEEELAEELTETTEEEEKAAVSELGEESTEEAPTEETAKKPE